MFAWVLKVVPNLASACILIYLRSSLKSVECKYILLFHSSVQFCYSIPLIHHYGLHYSYIHYTIMVLLWLAGIQGDIIYVNTEVDTLMASVGLNPMGPVGCVLD